MVSYLDMIGKLHTPKAGNPELDVPLVQMNALMGFVSTALTSIVLSFNLDRETEKKTLLAFNKLLWIQNDLITRNYQDWRTLNQDLLPSKVAGGMTPAASSP